MKLPNFIATVRKCLEVEVKDTVELDKIHDVILLSFEQLDDSTKVGLILAGLNDDIIDSILAKEKNIETVSDLEKVNKAELLKWRSWIMKTVVIFGGVIAIGLLFIMFTGSGNCDPESTTNILYEIKKFIELILLNKTE
jgi:hypothetical protein